VKMYMGVRTMVFIRSLAKGSEDFARLPQHTISKGSKLHKCITLSTFVKRIEVRLTKRQPPYGQCRFSKSILSSGKASRQCFDL